MFLLMTPQVTQVLVKVLQTLTMTKDVAVNTFY